jgi:hypothetical protein
MMRAIHSMPTRSHSVSAEVPQPYGARHAVSP